jgi:hypothetical protein
MAKADGLVLYIGTHANEGGALTMTLSTASTPLGA